MNTHTLGDLPQKPITAEVAGSVCSRSLGYPSSLNVNRPVQPFPGVGGISEREVTRVCMRLDEHFVLARRHAAALVLARRVGDEAVGATAAAHLRRTLLRAVGIIDAAAAFDAQIHAILIATFNEATPAMYELLQGVPTSNSDFRPRLSRWEGATARLFEVRGGRSHVFKLDASGKDLQEAVVCGLHVSHSRFITDMRRARFVDSLVEASDFSYADLRGTLWQRARIRSCYFREVRFWDAAFDDTMFIDCDMRAADFSTDIANLSTTPGVTFIRCDLRGARWGGRDHSGFELLDCQLFDVADLATSTAQQDEPREPSTIGDGGAPQLAPMSDRGGVEARKLSLVAERCAP
jgi:uncharacterized protein YjbI with pentapeptide repeats